MSSHCLCISQKQDRLLDIHGHQVTNASCDQFLLLCDVTGMTYMYVVLPFAYVANDETVVDGATPVTTVPFCK